MCGRGNFGIREDYRHQALLGGVPAPYKDSVKRSRRSQAEVYRIARKLVVHEDLASVADIGCGLGHKLAEFITPVCESVAGIDCPEAIAYCKRHHRFGRWEIDDIAHPRFPVDPPFDLIIAADVIEHLANPDVLLEYLKKLTHPSSLLLLSTPERSRLRGREHLGPPPNPFHVREWSSDEFRNYLTGSGLTVVDHETVFCDRPTWFGRMRAAFWYPRDSGWHCQVAVCRPAATGPPSERQSPKIRTEGDGTERPELSVSFRGLGPAKIREVTT